MSVIFPRLACLADAEKATDVLRRSITLLCVLDHQNDAPTLQRWLRNKTPQIFCDWVADPNSRIIVAPIGGDLAGVAALHRSGEIRLCYVSPDFVRGGVGRALLGALESEAQNWGITQLRLQSSLTARPFYESCGYLSSGDAVPSFGVLRGYPYAKTLSP